MIPAFKVEPGRLRPDNTSELAAVIVAVGYERRSRFVAERLADRARVRVASAFLAQRVESFDENMQWMSDSNFTVESHTDEEFSSWLSNQLASVAAASTDHKQTVCIDISSLSRNRLARAVWSVLASNVLDHLSVEFAYAPAQYEEPPEFGAPMGIAEPAIPEFSGWSGDPATPISMVVGVGYEPEKAIGSVEYFEATSVWAFAPTGTDTRYDASVLAANRSLHEFVAGSQHWVEYPVLDAYRTFTTLESLSSGLLTEGRVLLVPFGPKSFALACMLVAAEHWPAVAVWRVSSGQLGVPFDRDASGPICSLRISRQD